MPRPYCQQPKACRAGKRGACPLCHKETLTEVAERMSERMRRLHADPEFAAKHSERMRRLHAAHRKAAT